MGETTSSERGKTEEKVKTLKVMVEDIHGFIFDPKNGFSVRMVRAEEKISTIEKIGGRFIWIASILFATIIGSIIVNGFTK